MGRLGSLWRPVCFLAAILALSAPAIGHADSGFGRGSGSGPGWSGSRPGWGGYDPAWSANRDRWGGNDRWRGSDWNLGRYGEWYGGRGSDRGLRWNRDSRLDSDWRPDGSWSRGDSDRGWWCDSDRFENDRSVIRPPRVIQVAPNRPIYVRPNSRVIIIEPSR